MPREKTKYEICLEVHSNSVDEKTYDDIKMVIDMMKAMSEDMGLHPKDIMIGDYNSPIYARIRVNEDKDLPDTF